MNNGQNHGQIRSMSAGLTSWFRAQRPSEIPTVFDPESLETVRSYYRQSAPTPLHSLPGLAGSLGLNAVLAKDESARFDLPAFKIAGARYAVHRLLQSTERMPSALAAASTGNHGRAVARAARDHGLAAHIYLPTGTLPARIAALESEGADVIVTDSGYDEAVRMMARDAESRGWAIVSDASWDGYDQVPRWIMEGYTLILDEARAQWPGDRPDLVVVQAGVGSLAAAVAAWLHLTYGEHRPTLVLAEPVGSACVLASLAEGRRVTLDQCAPTRMAGLWCAEVSPLAWPSLQALTDAAIAVTEDDDARAMTCLSDPLPGDPAIAAGPSGAAGLAALTRLMEDEDLASIRHALGVGPATRAMVIVTEGRTGESGESGGGAIRRGAR